MRCIVGYESSNEKSTLLDIVKGVSFIVLIFTPGFFASYFCPNTWISAFATLIPLVFIAVIVLWTLNRAL